MYLKTHHTQQTNTEEVDSEREILMTERANLRVRSSSTHSEIQLANGRLFQIYNGYGDQARCVNSANLKRVMVFHFHNACSPSLVRSLCYLKLR